jgi:hypothetical protein
MEVVCEVGDCSRIVAVPGVLISCFALVIHYCPHIHLINYLLLHVFIYCFPTYKKIKLSLCFIKHRALKTCLGVEV